MPDNGSSDQDARDSLVAAIAANARACESAAGRGRDAPAAAAFAAAARDLAAALIAVDGSSAEARPPVAADALPVPFVKTEGWTERAHQLISRFER